MTSDGASTNDQPIDPDVGPADRLVGSTRAHHRGRVAWRVLVDRRDILAVISSGGAIGAVMRWQLLSAFPHTPGSVAWNTFAINTAGSFLLGILMVIVADVTPHQRLLRPFVGVGLLGGFTTFSTASLDVHEMLRAGNGLDAVAFVALSLIGGFAAMLAAMIIARTVLGRRRSSNTRAAS